MTSTVTFSAGQVEATLLVSTVEDTMKEPTEQFSARLQNPTGGAVVGTADTAQISIQDDDGNYVTSSVTYIFYYEHNSTIAESFLR